MSLKINLIIFFIFIFKLNCFKFDFNLQYLKAVNDTVFDQFILSLINIISNQVKNYENLTDITFDCKMMLDQTFFILNKNDYDEEEKYLAYYYYTKLLLDSSTNVNDLSSYPKCMNKDHLYDFSNSKRKPMKPLYVTLFVDNRENILNYFRGNETITNYLVGICFIKGCSDNDLRILAENIMNLLGILQDNKTVEIYTLDGKYEPNLGILALKLIPANILFIHLFIVIFHKFFLFLFRQIKDLCCHKNQARTISLRLDANIESKNYIMNDDSRQKQNQTFKNYMKLLFNVGHNFEFLFHSSNKDEINSDSTLSYMNGIKGISLFTLIFGFVFIDLYNTPITKQSVDSYFETMSHPLFFIFYFGIKYAPKLLLCSSGFSLFFKFMCFLDDKTEIEKELKKLKEELIKEKINRENMGKNIELKDNNNETGNTCNNNTNNNDTNKESLSWEDSSYSTKYSKKTTRIKTEVPLKYLFWFIGSQIHKYILYLLIIFFTLFSLYDFVIFFIELGPMWNFFKQKLIDSSTDFINVLRGILCLQGNFFFNFNVDSIYTYFYLIYQEIIFFILSSLIIYIGYRFNLRIDRFILATISLLFVFRVFYYYLSDNLNVRYYFDLNNYAGFYHSAIYNYLYYILGIYFGCLNYVIQKGYTYYECDTQGKVYLLGFTRLLKIIKRKTKCFFYTLGIIFLVLIILFTFTQYWLYKYVIFIKDLDDKNIQDYNTILNSYNEDILSSVVLMFDADIVVLLVNFMALLFYLKGENYIDDFLNLNFFAIFNKIYFSCLLLINPIIFYVFYMTESRINFTLENCYLYTFACGILIFIFAILLYGIFELPYKKVFKLLLKRNDLKVEEKRLGFIEKKSFIKRIDNKGSSNNDDQNENEETNLFGEEEEEKLKQLDNENDDNNTVHLFEQ